MTTRKQRKREREREKKRQAKRRRDARRRAFLLFVLAAGLVLCVAVYLVDTGIA